MIRVRKFLLRTVLAIVIVLVIGGVSLLIVIKSTVNSSTDALYDGRLVDADYWDAEPKILSAGFGFDGIIGAPDDDEQTTIDAGGAWDSTLECAKSGGPTSADRSSLALASSIKISALAESGAATEYVDGLPVVFSWPIRTNTIRPSQFQFTLNTGEIASVQIVTMTPNFELDERNTVVMFADQIGEPRLTEFRSRSAMIAGSHSQCSGVIEIPREIVIIDTDHDGFESRTAKRSSCEFAVHSQQARDVHLVESDGIDIMNVIDGTNS